MPLTELGILQGLKGRTEQWTTERYPHIGPSPVLEAAEKVSARLEAAMASKDASKADVVELGREEDAARSGPLKRTPGNGQDPKTRED